MVQVRYVGDEPRQVSILPAGELRALEPDEVFEVPDEWAPSYECQPALYDVPEIAPEKKDGDDDGGR